MTTILFPSFSRRSTRCEPMKPAPPVTRTNEDGGWRMEDGIGVLQVDDFPQKSSARAIILLSIAPMLCQAASICLNSSDEMQPQSRQSSSQDCVSVASPSASSILLMKTE